VDYTREPIVETVITPKDGHRIAVRSSKNPGQEEFLVDALEVVTFGSSCFFRNSERPRAFMVPASDYEVLEVREAKLPLKAASLEGSVRLPSGPKSAPREPERRKPLPKEPEPVPAPEVEKPLAPTSVSEEPPVVPSEHRHERRSERRRGQRRRRGGREEIGAEEPKGVSPKEAMVEEQPMQPKEEPASPKETPPPTVTTVLPPPQTLIRDDLERLRRNDQYKGAFYLRESDEEPKKAADVEDIPIVPFNLQGADEPASRPPEEDIYKATPAPSEE
jgi:hypothetical protein